MKNLTSLLHPHSSCSKLFALFLVCLWPFLGLSAQNTLRVGDPRNTWYTQQGTIEEATISVAPQGAYWEIGLYLTFSARGSQWHNQSDSLEISYFFDLPAGAIVHDSWLWIGEDIIKAKILDKWTARAIYEGYVKRRTDPSILYKNSETQYELRVFPMAGNETRKVKLSYLLPAQWSPGKVQAALPLHLLQSSLYPPKLEILARANAYGSQPTLEGYPNAFKPVGPQYPNLFQANLGQVSLPNVNMSYKTPDNKGYYVSTLGAGNEGFYQVTLLPSSLLTSQYKKKVALLLDYDASGGNHTTQEVLSAAKNALLNRLSPSDSFNLIFSNFSIKRASNNWLPADAPTIEAAFKALQNSLSNYSNMTALLANGIDFVRQNGADGQLILLSNASQVSSVPAANTLLKDVLAQMPVIFPIHVVDYYSSNQVYQYLNGIAYYGNAYFLKLLAAQTKGQYHEARYSVLQDAAMKAMGNLDANIEAFDFHTKLANGFCYGRFYPNGEHNVAYVHQPIVQIGKYKGTFPFNIEVSGEYQGQVFNQEISVPESEIIPGDSLLREMWFGQYLQLLESENEQNTIIQEIISTSLQERVLSKYTAFFCPEDTSLICACTDETIITVSTSTAFRDSLMSAFPNPFKESVNIRVKNMALTNRDATLEIMTIDGRLVRILNLPANTDDEAMVQWDGQNSDGMNVEAGVYLALLKTGNKTSVLKLVKMR